MKKVKVFKIFILAGAILGLTILSIIVYIRSKPSVTILSNPICSPPCWQNITPGMSTAEETVSILKNTSLVDPTSVIRGRSWFIFDEVVYFQLRPKPVKGSIFFLDGKVSIIFFDGDLHLTFGQVVDSFGEPEYITNTPL